jgi:hypothetical protein
MVRRLLVLSALAIAVIAMQKAASKRAALKTFDSTAEAEWESEGGPPLPAEPVASSG